MKKFKTIDVALSILLLVSFTLYAIIDSKYLFVGYFVIGGWQVISMMVHAGKKWFTPRQSARYNYHLIVLIIVSLAVTGMVVQILLTALLFILIFASPFMAIYYTWLCYHEVNVKMRRPLAALK